MAASSRPPHATAPEPVGPLRAVVAAGRFSSCSSSVSSWCKAAIDSYLRSDGFRQFVAQKAGGTLHADAELAPLHFSGDERFSPMASARRAGPSAAFADLQLEQIRAEISLRRFFEQVWQVEQIDVQRLRVNLDGPRADRPPEPPPIPSKRRRRRAPRNTTAAAGCRTASKSAAPSSATRNSSGPAADCAAPPSTSSRTKAAGRSPARAGASSTASCRPLDVAQLQLRYRAPSLFVNSAELRQPGGGSVQATGRGEFRAPTRPAPHARSNIDIAPYLSDDWRVRLKGALAGEVTVQSALPVGPGPKITGTLKLSQGELTALPVLDQIAAFTRTQQFRRLTLEPTPRATSSRKGRG